MSKLRIDADRFSALLVLSFILFPSLLFANESPGQEVSARSDQIISLASDLTFLDPAGDPIVVPAGHYLASADKDNILLTDLNDEGVTIAAEASEHTDELASEQSALLFGDPGYVHIVVLTMDGVALEAIGSESGVFTRDIRRNRFMAVSKKATSAPQRVTTAEMQRQQVPTQYLSYIQKVRSMPDLVFSSCQFRPEGGGGKFIAVLKNQGRASASFATNWVVASASGATTYSSVASGGGLYLAPGATHSVQVSLGNRDAGVYTITWDADPDKRVAEAAEFNNRRSCSGTVSAAPPIPQAQYDLIISNIIVQPRSGTPSTTFTITRTVTNIGTENSPTGSPIFPRCTIDGRPMLGNEDAWRTSSIPPSGSRNFVRRNLRGFIPGSHKLECMVDYSNDASELREDNNRMSRTIHVACGEGPCDADNDGIRDDVDQCPYDAEIINGIYDSDGCPDATGGSSP